MNSHLREKVTRYRILFARQTRTIVVWISTALAAGFTVFQFSGLTFEPIITATSSQIIWRGALIAYLWCWRYGCIFDTDIQELAYASFPYKWSLKSYSVVALLISAAIALCVTQGDILWFSVALAGFFFVDHFGWLHLMNVLVDDAKKSENQFSRSRDFFALERLKVVRSQVCGNWKWMRNIVGGMIVLLALAFAFVPQVGSFFGGFILRIKPNFESSQSQVLAYSFVVLAFVVVMEGWHYWKRLQTKISMDLLDKLAEQYELRKLSE